MIAEIFHSGESVSASVSLPGSKSICNRVLIIHALGKLTSSINNISEANDTAELQAALNSHADEINAGEGGTTLRFLLAYFCLTGRSVVLTASEPMKKRPVANLVDALCQLGASIEYLEEAGKLPVRITPSELKGNSIIVDGSISSQFISALMLIGPYVKGGITIHITGEILSLPYIQMTQNVMNYFGASVSFEDATVRIEEGNYANREITIEPDWSAASYWYEIAALGNNSEIRLSGLRKDSLQGDSILSEMMKQLGVTTTFEESGALIQKQSSFNIPSYFIHDFIGCPDLGPAVAAVCAGLNITADLTGLKNFRLKESDRASSLQRELYNMNVKTDFCGGSKFKLYSGSGIRKYNRPVKTYNDHRIAMTFACLALKTGSVTIEDSEVVKKSYPGFYSDLERAGFRVEFR